MYGQTGSGKTFTMFGSDDAMAAGGSGTRSRSGSTSVGGVPGGGGGGGSGSALNNVSDNTNTFSGGWEDRGIVPRACHEIMSATDSRLREHGIQAELAVSYVEVFGNAVSDLLNGGETVRASERVGHRMQQWREAKVTGAGDIGALLKEGEEQKRKAATAMNERSTRAHSVFVVRLTQVDPATGVEVTSRLFLADLGGSEKLDKSEANAMIVSKQEAGTFAQYYALRARLQETNNINIGLFALKR